MDDMVVHPKLWGRWFRGSPEGNIGGNRTGVVKAGMRGRDGGRGGERGRGRER